MSRPPRHNARRRTLRWATHNVCGLRAHAAAVAKLWVEQDFDGVCLQEVHLAPLEIDKVMHTINQAVKGHAKRLNQPAHKGFKWLHSINSSNPNAAGALLAWKASLEDYGGFKVQFDSAIQARDGRLAAIKVQWGGHALQLASVYCPNDSVARQQFLSGPVKAAWSRAPQHSVFLGDWNFVEVPDADRRWRGGRPAAADPNSDRPSKAAWSAAAPGAADVYRLRHPNRRGGYTFFHRNNGHVARLDRAYVGSALSQYVLTCYDVPTVAASRGHIF